MPDPSVNGEWSVEAQDLVKKFGQFVASVFSADY
jgi:hypothetical protein